MSIRHVECGTCDDRGCSRCLPATSGGVPQHDRFGRPAEVSDGRVVGPPRVIAESVRITRNVHHGHWTVSFWTLAGERLGEINLSRAAVIDLVRGLVGWIGGAR